ncbi:hypothetical protein [Ktedonospora formicarum]|uniref:Uncharacterized protein n=1 Tax=Ktedonospora formicarum TaxID=2778364 RepID=A0A8J3MX23_9CHLR|nr:hypothetical protein [Ktedonospora formicarum]GHO48140.1 hypothetical protein KSX_63030 [Ktedonospora formicarum]
MKRFGNQSDLNKLIERLHAKDRRMAKFCTSHAACRVANGNALAADDAAVQREIEEMNHKDQAAAAALTAKAEEVETSISGAEDALDEGDLSEAQQKIRDMASYFDELAAQYEADGLPKKAAATRKEKQQQLDRLRKIATDTQKADSVEARNRLRTARKERTQQQFGWLLKRLNKS